MKSNQSNYIQIILDWNVRGISRKKIQKIISAFQTAYDIVIINLKIPLNLSDPNIEKIDLLPQGNLKPKGYTTYNKHLEKSKLTKN